MSYAGTTYAGTTYAGGATAAAPPNEGAATLAGTASLIAIGAITQAYASATLDGAATLTAQPSYTGSATLDGTATLTVTGEAAFTSTAALNGAATLTAAGGIFVYGSSALAAAGTLVVVGNAITTNTVNNAGIAGTPNLTVTVTGPAASPVILQSLTDGKTLTIAQTVPSGQDLVVDFLRRRVTLNGVAVGGVTGAWWELRPGDNDVHANRPATVVHRAAYV